MKEAIRELKELEVKRIFVQYPEGLRLRIQKIVKELEKEGFDVILCNESTYGACDVREHEAKLLRCDAILHIGHGDFGVKTEMPVVYADYFIEADPLPILEKEFKQLEGYQNIGLATSIQFVKTLPVIKEFLEKKGKKVFIGKSTTEKYHGQILGCRLGAAKEIEDKVDCFLCISAGKFYGLGLTLKTDKPMLNLDFEKGTIRDMEDFKKKIQKIIAWNKAEFKEARRVGILVSFKLGQFTMPYRIKEKLEGDGKETYIIAMDEITKDKLAGLKLDFLVNTACSRIGTDNLEMYDLPILNWDQIG